MKNILIALDFEDNVKTLINKTKELIALPGSKIWLLHIAAPDPDFVGYEPGPQYIRDDRARQLLTEHKILAGYVNDLRKEGCEVEGLLIQGPTTETILEESNKLAIDLVITGRHEHGWLYKIFNNPTSAEITNSAKIPVLVIPL